MSLARIAVCLSLLLGNIFPAVACAQEPENGTSFLTTRNMLISEGWQPLNVHEGKKFSPMGIERQLIKAHIQEVDSCAVDMPLCLFHYKKADKCLRLVTQGETLQDLSVYNFTYECPDKS
jgi:hypothetical protein